MPAADDGDKSIIETKAAREDAGGLDAEVLRTIFAASPKRDKFVRVFAAIYLDGRKLAELGHPAAYVHKMGLAFLRGRAATVARQFGMEASS